MRRIGLALGVSTSWAVRLTGATPPSRITDNGQRTTPLPGVTPNGEGLAAVLEGLRNAFGPGPMRLSVTLLPDLCQIRRITLPRLRDQERRSVLGRTLHRHFPRGAEPHAFGSESCPGGVMAAAAPLVLIQALEREVAGAGWRLGTVQPAEAAWAAAAEATERGTQRVAVALADRVEVLTLERGRVREVRRLLPRLADQACAGVRMLERPGEAAAAFANRARGPEIVTDAAWDLRRRDARRGRRVMAAAAGILLLVGGAAEWWSVTRELAALRAERMRQSGAVAQALSERERVATLEARYELLAPEAGGTRWSRVLADVTGHLPHTAYLSAFRAAGDSLALDGLAREAGPVLESLRAAPSVSALRATAPIRREAGLGANGDALERFALAARLVSRPPPR